MSCIARTRTYLYRAERGAYGRGAEGEGEGEWGKGGRGRVCAVPGLFSPRGGLLAVTNARGRVVMYTPAQSSIPSRPEVRREKRQREKRRRGRIVFHLLHHYPFV